MKMITLSLFLLPFGVNAQFITTYAGNGIDGYIGDGGFSYNAELEYVDGLNFDFSGNLIICHNSFVRKVSSSTNIISTIAGSDTASSLGGGGNGGPATCADVVEPYAVCLDTKGNLYIADYWADQIRKVDATTGIISAYAGTKTVGYTGDGGAATNASFNSLFCVCIDTAKGYLYIADEFNYRVRRVDMSTGIVTTYAGTGTNGYSNDGQPATSANFSRVIGLVLDRSGNLYIGDWDNGRIRKVDASTGIVTTFAGSGTTGYFGDGGLATNAMIDKTTAMCFDSCGNMFFTDENNQRVRRIDIVTHIITTVAGNGTAGFLGDDGPATAAEFNHPTGICIDHQGSLYVSDYYNQRVRKITFGTKCDGTPSHVDVDEINLSADLSVFPNPTYDILNINNLKTPASYTLQSIVGATVLQGTLKEGNNSINIQAVPNSMYMLVISSLSTSVMVSLPNQGRGEVRTVNKIIKQ